MKYVVSSLLFFATAFFPVGYGCTFPNRRAQRDRNNSNPYNLDMQVGYVVFCVKCQVKGEH